MRRSGVLEALSGSFDDDLRELRDELCRFFLDFDVSASWSRSLSRGLDGMVPV